MVYLQTIASPRRQPKTESGIWLGLFKDSHKIRQPTDSGRGKSCNLTLRIDYHPSIFPNYITQYFKTVKDHNRSDNPGNQMGLHTLLLICNTSWEGFSQADLSKKYLLTSYLLTHDQTPLWSSSTFSHARSPILLDTSLSPLWCLSG